MYIMKKAATWSLTIAVIGAAFAQTAQGQIIAGRSSNTEPAIHIDINTFVTTDLFTLSESGFNGSGVEGLAVDDANRTIYVCSGATSPNRQWILSAHYDDRLFDNPSRLRLRKVVDVSPFLRLSGLAYDTTAGKLYATYPFGSASEGVYEVNLTTGVLTLVYDGSAIASAIDLRGFDFNPADGLLYATDLATTAPGRALVSINLNTATLTDIASSIPLVAAASGMAIANNKAYIVPDDDNVGSNAAGPIRVFDIASGTYDADLFNPWTGDATSAGAGWGPSALDVPAGVNLAVDAIVSNRDTAVDWEDGTVISYTLRFTNFGPSNATNVTYTISLGGDATGTISNISSTSASAVESPTGTVTATLTDLFVGQIETVSFDVTTTSAGVLTVTANIPPGANSDPYLGNNSESISHNIRTFPEIVLVFTNEQSSPASDVPGMGLKFEFATSTTQKFRKPYRSPNGQFVALWSDTNAATTVDEVYMYKDAGGNWSVAAQEGVTATANGDLLGSMILNPPISLNNLGHYAIANDTNAATNADETILVFNGTQHVAVAREGQPIPALGGTVNYSSTMDSPAIDGQSRAAFRVASLAGTAAVNSVLLADNGTRLLAQKGVTVPSGQAGGASETWELFDQDTLYIDCAGVQWIVQGDLTGATAGDDILAVNNQVVLQQGQGVAGLTGTIPEPSTTAGIIFAEMYGNGVWYARGTTTVTDQDFIIRGVGTSYSIVAKHGDEIYPGAGENWSDVDGYSPTFFGYAENSQGDYVIVGRTNNADVDRNAVVVFNGTTELFREGDRVDLDQNGFFDDDAFVSNFDVNIADWLTLTDTGEFYVSANLRNTANAFIGKALLRFDVAASPLPAGADLLVTKTVSDNFLESVGQQTVFTVRVCSYGPNDATNVVLNDPLPNGLAFVSATNGATETSPGSNVVTATIATLPSCGCEVYEITVEAVAEGVWENTASVSGNESDPNLDNNSASATVTVENQADVAVTKEDDGGAPVGVNFTYTITITNNGPATATNVQMTDTLDGLTSFVSATNGATETAPGSGIVTVTFASIPANSSEIVTITVVGNFQALVTNTVTVTATEVDLNPSNNDASVDTLVGDVANVSVTKVDDGLHRVGENITYTVTVSNAGPGTATNVQVVDTLPAGVVFVSATNGAVENPPGSGNVVRTFPSILQNGSEVITIVVNAPNAGTFVNSVTVEADEIDPDDLNNSASVSTRVGEFRNIKPILTAISGHPTAQAVGARDANGNLISTEYGGSPSLTFDALAVSPDGNKWLVRGQTLQPIDESQCLILGEGMSGAIFLQENQLVPGGGPTERWDFFDTHPPGGFNDANEVAFSVRVKGGTAGTLERIYRTDNGNLIEVLRQGNLLLGVTDNPPSSSGDEGLGNSVSGVHLLNDDRVGYYVTPIENCHSSRYPGLFYNNVAHVHSGASPLGPSFWKSFTSASFYTSPDGMHWIARGNYDDGSTFGIPVFSYNGAVSILQGDTIGAHSVSSILGSSMANDGTWFARGKTTTNADYAVMNGMLVAESDASVAGGAETWANSGTSSATITGVAGNTVGDYVVTGTTSEPDPLFNSVIAMNGTDVVVRIGDPVDLDGNGLFDDDLFVRTITGATVNLTDDGRIYFIGTLRNSEGVNLLPALLTVDLSAATCPTIQGDADGDGARNGIDVSAFVDCILTGGTPTGSCVCVDYDSNNVIDLDDLDAFATQLVTDP